MAQDTLWRKLLTPETLKAAWHLVRAEIRQDFINWAYYCEPFTTSYDENIREIEHRLRTDSYTPSPLIQIDVPKSTLAIRPGSLPNIEDRIVLQAIVYLLAPIADNYLTDGVYSYRVKKPPKKGVLFKESDVFDIPYLKARTIHQKIDPFEPWYDSWPEFDADSRAAFIEDGYYFLAISDISAYFENIQLPILRDDLLRLFHDEPRLINLLFSFLESWTVKTLDGRPHWRGIPQGTQISSFLGNIFLMPLDEEFEIFCEKNEAKYFRYMDDVRVFTKDYETARLAILTIDRVLRKRHLNTQSAKTEILREKPHREITHRLIDPRIDEINAIIDQINESKGRLSSTKRSHFLRRLNDVAKTQPDSPLEQPILGQRKSLKGLSLRLFRRWITAHSRLGSHKYIYWLVKESRVNPDHRITRRFVTTIRRFPRRWALNQKLFAFINSDLNIFPHQEAELLWSIRYSSRIDDEIIDHCKDRLLNMKDYYYVRMQAAYLLSRVVLDRNFLARCENLFNSEPNPLVQAAIAGLLMQLKGKKNSKALNSILYHPNNDIRKLGNYFRDQKIDPSKGITTLSFITDPNISWRICDYTPLLFVCSQSSNKRILRYLLKRVREFKTQCRLLDLHPLLDEVIMRSDAKLKR